MKEKWDRLPEPVRHLLTVLGAVLITTLPVMVLGLDNRCIQLFNACR